MKRILVLLGTLGVLALIEIGAAYSQTITGPDAPGQGISAFGPPRGTTTATILSGASLSGALDLKHRTLSRIIIPSAWTTANLTFQASYDCTNYADLYDASGTEYTVTVGGTSRAILIPIVDFLGIRCLKIRSGTTGTPVTQGADRTLNLVVVN